MGGIKPREVALTEKADGMELAKLAAGHADGIIFAAKDLPEELRGFCEGLPAPVLPYDEASYADGSYMDQYNRFYDSLL